MGRWAGEESSRTPRHCSVRPVFLESGELSSPERGLNRTQTDSEGKGLFSVLTSALASFLFLWFSGAGWEGFFFFFRVVGCSATSVTVGTFHSYLEMLCPAVTILLREMSQRA